MGIAFCLYWGELRWYHALAATFYVANFDSHLPWFLGHLWSLSVEEQFYFLWPGVLKKWYEHRVGILLGVIALAPVYKLSCFLLGFRSAAETTFPAVADNLAIGCLAAVLAPRVGRIKPALGWLALLAIALVPAFPPVTRYRTILLLFLLGQVMEVAIAVFLLQAVQTPYRILNARPVVWLGKISYSLYLWQQLFSWGPRHKPWYFLLGALGLAALSYHVVEQPMLRLRESRTRDEKEDATYALARAGD
jgi:peptidoglycan/LPS O-acetylase OafA/YrhL